MPWIDAVDGVLEVWYAGEQMGPAIAALLWGDVEPSGKLTHSFPRSEADLPTAGDPAQYPGTFSDGSVVPAAGQHRAAPGRRTRRACRSATAGTRRRASSRCSRSATG